MTTAALAYPAERRLAGIGLILAAIALYAGQDAVAKFLTASFSTWQILFFRALGSLLLLAPLAARVPLRAWRSRQPLMLLLRCVSGTAGMGFYILAFASMPLADVSAIGFSGPLIATVGAMLFLKEQMGWRRWMAVLVGFGGVLIILRPGSGVFAPAAVWALLGAVCFAGITLSLRLLARTDHPVAVTLSFSAFCLVASAAALPLVWRTPDAGEFALLIGQGMFCGAGQLLMAQALRLAPASTVSAFTYTIILYGAAIGFVWFGDTPDPVMMAGAAVLVASCLYIAHRERLHQAGAS
jgi:drug/metabolite transporter (DMT)-like permease